MPAARRSTDLQRRTGGRRVAPLYGSVDPAVHKPTAAGSGVPGRSVLSGHLVRRSRRGAADASAYRTCATAARHESSSSAGRCTAAIFPGCRISTWSVICRRPSIRRFIVLRSLTLNVTRGPMAEWATVPRADCSKRGLRRAVLSDYWDGLETFLRAGLRDSGWAATLKTHSRRLTGLRRIWRASAAPRASAHSSHTADTRVAELEQILETACNDSPAARRGIACGA